MITGPYNSVRGMADGDLVKIDNGRRKSDVNKIFESAMIALDAIWSAKLRSFMTVLGNIVAVTSIIAVVSLIQGLNASVKHGDPQPGRRRLVQRPAVPDHAQRRRVREGARQPAHHAERRQGDQALQRPGRARSWSTRRRRARVTYRDKSIDQTQVHGVTSEYVDFSTFDAERGRLMSPTEVDTVRPVTVIGWQTADRLFGADVDPLDKMIQIDGVHFRVVGVSAKKGSLLGRSQDEFAVIPLGAVPDDLRIAPPALGHRQAARSRPDAPRRWTMRRWRCGSTRRLKPKQPDNFGLFTSDTILDIYHSATNGIFAVLIGVVALSLVVGGIVIMNIMLMVVTERTREIGLRKALGARRSDIMAQMLTESVVLSIFGGIVGTILGRRDRVRDRVASRRFRPTWNCGRSASASGITALVGLFFGIYPAMQAASLDPIEALRKE